MAKEQVMKQPPADGEEILVDQFKFEKIGDTIQGVLVAKDVSSFGTGAYLIAVDEETTVSILGSTGMDRLLANINVNTKIWIQLSEIKALAGGKTFKVYRVFRLPPD